ncbi:hypothetical protein [Ferroglobus sp.]|nr:hypothetical protein [Ferroglobus sp.]
MMKIWCEKSKLLFINPDCCVKMLCKYYVANGGVCFSKFVEVHAFI